MAIIRKEPASYDEHEKLVAEIQDLIERKGLGVELTRTRELDAAASGCTSCTICPCMICW